MADAAQQPGRRFIPPQPWERYVELLDTTDDSYFTGVINTMRLAHGLPPVGHGMTYDFMVLHRGAVRVRERRDVEWVYARGRSSVGGHRIELRDAA